MHNNAYNKRYPLLAIRIRPEQDTYLRAKAESLGIKLTAYVRSVLFPYTVKKEVTKSLTSENNTVNINPDVNNESIGGQNGTDNLATDSPDGHPTSTDSAANPRA